ncbi:MAG: SLATT domain-containing protein [Candidatus Uhrbacteria bacterium]|nr:SLATT domain-containing protein [Candidatus Uhrbacteria bacterium]
MDIKNLSIIRQTFANAVFTHKVQEVAAENAGRKAMYVKITNIILVGIALSLFILQAYNLHIALFSFLGVGVTIAEVIFLIIQLSFDFEQKKILHKNSALKYMGLRDCYRSLITDIMNESLSQDSLLAGRDALQREYNIISELAPQTGSQEYTETQIRLNKNGKVEGEEFTWSDEEIDRFLPESLRLKK